MNSVTIKVGRQKMQTVNAYDTDRRDTQHKWTGKSVSDREKEGSVTVGIAILETVSFYCNG